MAYRRAVFGSAFATVLALSSLSDPWIQSPLLQFLTVFALLSLTEIVRRVSGGDRLRDCLEFPVRMLLFDPALVVLSAVLIVVVLPICPWVASAVVVYAWGVYLTRPKDLPFSLLNQPTAFRRRVSRYRIAARVGLGVASLLVLWCWG